MGVFFSMPPTKQMLQTAVISMVSVVAGALAGTVLVAAKAPFSRIVTEPQLDALKRKLSEQQRLTDARLLVLEDASRKASAHISQLTRSSEQHELERRRASELLVHAYGQRVRLQAMLMLGLDPKRKAAAERAAAQVGRHYDDLVLRAVTSCKEPERHNNCVDPLGLAGQALEYLRGQ